ncbi:MAG: CooT family nickel-binding protein [Lachnospiraceae bacterium]|nr:CooT family nickel-binding protein [Lachnospiraceae bacterium]
MCLARVYGHKKDEEEILLADSIANIIPEGGKVRMLDIFGDETVVEGTLLSLDLERNTVKIQLV